ncbi:hypothetical protein ACHAWF_017559 [Thalassiosira exigua]
MTDHASSPAPAPAPPDPFGPSPTVVDLPPAPVGGNDNVAAALASSTPSTTPSTTASHPPSHPSPAPSSGGWGASLAGMGAMGGSLVASARGAASAAASSAGKGVGGGGRGAGGRGGGGGGGASESSGGAEEGSSAFLSSFTANLATSVRDLNAGLSANLSAATAASPSAASAASQSIGSVSLHLKNLGQSLGNSVAGRNTLPDRTTASQVLMFRQLLHTRCRPGLRLSRKYEGTDAQRAVLHMPVTAFVRRLVLVGRTAGVRCAPEQEGASNSEPIETHLYFTPPSSLARDAPVETNRNETKRTEPDETSVFAIQLSFPKWWERGIEQTRKMVISYDNLVTRLWLSGAILPFERGGCAAEGGDGEGEGNVAGEGSGTKGPIDTLIDERGLPPVPHAYWVDRLGFQQDDPVTDFRSGGVSRALCFIVLRCLVRRPASRAQRSEGIPMGKNGSAEPPCSRAVGPRGNSREGVKRGRTVKRSPSAMCYTYYCEPSVDGASDCHPSDRISQWPWPPLLELNIRAFLRDDTNTNNDATIASKSLAHRSGSTTNEERVRSMPQRRSNSRSAFPSLRRRKVLSLAMLVHIVESCQAIHSRFVPKPNTNASECAKDGPDEIITLEGIVSDDASVLPFGITCINVTNMLAKFLMFSKAVDKMDALLSAKPFWRMCIDPNAMLVLQEVSLDLLCDVCVEIGRERRVRKIVEKNEGGGGGKDGGGGGMSMTREGKRRVGEEVLGAGPQNVEELRAVARRVKSKYLMRVQMKGKHLVNPLPSSPLGKQVPPVPSKESVKNVTRSAIDGEGGFVGGMLRKPRPEKEDGGPSTQVIDFTSTSKSGNDGGQVEVGIDGATSASASGAPTSPANPFAPSSQTSPEKAGRDEASGATDELEQLSAELGELSAAVGGDFDLLGGDDLPSAGDDGHHSEELLDAMDEKVDPFAAFAIDEDELFS